MNKENKIMFGVYRVVYAKKGKKIRFLVAKYKEGYGLLGGRLNKKEGLRKAFIRELGEEVGIKNEQVVKLILTQKINSFASKRANGTERHRFLICKIDDKANPIKKEVNFEWLSESAMAKLTKWEGTQKIINVLIDKIQSAKL